MGPLEGDTVCRILMSGVRSLYRRDPKYSVTHCHGRTQEKNKEVSLHQMSNLLAPWTSQLLELFP